MTTASSQSVFSSTKPFCDNPKCSLRICSKCGKDYCKKNVFQYQPVMPVRTICVLSVGCGVMKACGNCGNACCEDCSEICSGCNKTSCKDCRTLCFDGCEEAQCNSCIYTNVMIVRESYALTVERIHQVNVLAVLISLNH